MDTKHSITITSAPVATALTERDPQARELVAGSAVRLDSAIMASYDAIVLRMGSAGGVPLVYWRLMDGDK